MPTKITNEILAILATHRRIPTEEAVTRTTTEFSGAFTDIIDKFVTTGQKIRIVIPSFPQKSPIRDKTLSDNPDMAEIISLQHLNALCEQIRAVYPAGAEIVVYNDGFAFDNVLPSNWTKANRLNYIAQLNELKNTLRFDNISFLDLSDTQLVTPHAETEEAFEARIKNPQSPSDQDSLTLYMGLKHFFQVEIQASNPDMSVKAVKKLASHVASGVARMSAALSKLLAHIEPNALRLSCHPKAVDSDKMGIWFNKDHSPGGTPWHNTAAFESKEGKYVASFMKSSEASAKGYRLHTDKAGNPSHYVSQDIYSAATKIQTFFRYAVETSSTKKATAAAKCLP